jgi:Cu/Ag efflux protein CusF
MKNTLSVWTVACATALTLTTLKSSADQPAAAAKLDTYSGTIVSIEPNERALDVKGVWMTKKFNLGDQCAYMLLDKPTGAIGDLRPGEKVTIQYQNAHGVKVADRIQQIPMTYEGTVKAINPAANTLTLRLQSGDRTFQVPENCKIVLRNNRSGSLDAVQPGNYVMVTYEMPGDKLLIAHQIAQTSESFVGQVTAIDLNDRTVKAKAMFGSKKFNLGDNCAIVVNGKMDTPLNEVKLGDRLEFNYDNVNGVNVANRIATTSQPSETTSTQP